MQRKFACMYFCSLVVVIDAGCVFHSITCSSSHKRQKGSAANFTVLRKMHLKVVYFIKNRLNRVQVYNLAQTWLQPRFCYSGKDEVLK